MNSLKYALFFVFAIAMFNSCDKEEETLVVITVKDIEGTPVQGALVRLFPEPSAEQPNELIGEVERTSDVAGEAIFDFSDYYEQGQAGLAVLNIEATKDTLAAQGIINIEPEQVNRQNIILQ